jgi:hypothetical protein
MSLECGFEVIRESVWISFWFVDFAVFVRLLVVISVTAGFWFNIIGVPLVLPFCNWLS